MKQKWINIVLFLLIILGTSSIWIYQVIKNRENTKNSQIMLNNLMENFNKQYPTGTFEQDLIEPHTFEVVWKGVDGSSNVSLCIGGVWVLIATTK